MALAPLSNPPPRRNPVRRLGAILLASGQGWVRHRAQSKGAALAFYTLFSMAPILVLAIAIAGRILGAQAVRGELFTQLQGVLGAHMALAVQGLVRDAHVPGAGRMATVLASGLLVVGATSVFTELKDSLDELWQQQAPIPRGVVAVLRSRLLAFALVLVLTFLVLVSLVLNGLLGLAQTFWPGTLPGLALLSPLVSFLLLVSLFAVIYKLLPEAKFSWGEVTMGALFTAVLFTLGRRLIGFYLSTSALGSSFGAAGSVAALLIWVYYSAQILFLGAEFIRAYAVASGSRRQPDIRMSPEEPSLY